jgi:hypothetical protein
MPLSNVPKLSDHNPELDVFAPCPCHSGEAAFRGWDTDGSPVHLLRERHNTNELPEWCDHAYRVLIVEPDIWAYVAEPYQLYAPAFDDFTFLKENGWTIELTAWRARHNPGHTLAVVITREAGIIPFGHASQVTISRSTRR